METQLNIFSHQDIDSLISYKEKLIEILKERKQEIEYNETLVDSVKAEWENTCSKIDKEFNDFLNRKITNLREIIKIEYAILESLKGIIPDNKIDDLRSCLVNARINNDLSTTVKVYQGSYATIHTRHVLKLVLSIYRYNRMILSGYKTKGVLSPIKSRIKYAMICPHCGTTALQVFNSLKENKSIILPEF